MDAYECVLTKLDVREFDSKPVAGEVKQRVLEAGRAAGTGMNVQHWRFVLVDSEEALGKLATDSTTGSWVEQAKFAIIILTDPKYGFHALDAGRALQNMQIAAWNFGVTSCIFTGFKREALQRDFNIPKELSASAVVGFGYPVRKLMGKKNRKPLPEVAASGRYGNPLKIS